MPKRIQRQLTGPCICGELTISRTASLSGNHRAARTHLPELRREGLSMEMTYPCGASAVGEGELPSVCPVHGVDCFRDDLNLDTITLTEGGHETRGSELCVGEAAAWYAGQPHSDQPITMSPEIGAFLRGLSVDIRDDATRTRLLRPLVPMIAYSAASPDVERRCRYRAIAWLVRMYVPLWITPALWVHGERLGIIKSITEQSWPSVQPILAEAFAAAADLAGVAYRPLTRDNGIEAAWDAIRAAQQVSDREHPSFIAWRQASAVTLVQELVAMIVIAHTEVAR